MHTLSSGKKCLLKGLESDEIGEKGTAMCEHLRDIHKVGDLILLVIIIQQQSSKSLHI